MIDGVEISTLNVVFSSDSDNEKEPELAIWPPKPDILITLATPQGREQRTSATNL